MSKKVGKKTESTPAIDKNTEYIKEPIQNKDGMDMIPEPPKKRH
jgi:hypothetical protein